MTLTNFSAAEAPVQFALDVGVANYLHHPPSAAQRAFREVAGVERLVGCETVAAVQNLCATLSSLARKAANEDTL